MARRTAAGVALCLVLAGGIASAADRRAPRVECQEPRLLRLVRYEDGSARLYCGERVLVRVSVPY
jgi:hypothetical protein